MKIRSILDRCDALPWVELLAGAPVEALQQQVHVVLLPLQTRLGGAQLFEQLHDQLLEHRHVVGQQGRIGQEGIGWGQGIRAHAPCYASSPSMVHAS